MTKKNLIKKMKKIIKRQKKLSLGLNSSLKKSVELFKHFEENKDVFLCEEVKKLTLTLAATNPLFMEGLRTIAAVVEELKKEEKTTEKKKTTKKKVVSKDNCNKEKESSGKEELKGEKENDEKDEKRPRKSNGTNSKKQKQDNPTNVKDGNDAGKDWEETILLRN